MPQRDTIHEMVKQALMKSGWDITHDPYTIFYGERFLHVDLGAVEMPQLGQLEGTIVGAQREGKRIAVEIKDFRNRGATMDTITIYHDILKQAILDYAKFRPSHGDIRTDALIDEARGRYALLHVGWDRGSRIHGNTLYVTLQGEKVHIEYDGFGYGISDDLVARGIPAEHIVLAYLPGAPTLAEYEREESRVKASPSSNGNEFNFAASRMHDHPSAIEAR